MGEAAGSTEDANQLARCEDDPMNANILYAVGGTILALLLELTGLRNTPRSQRPDFGEWLYWLPYVVYPAAGAFLVFVYEQSGVQFSAVLAANVGASAPLIFRSLTSASPFNRPLDPGVGA